MRNEDTDVTNSRNSNNFDFLRLLAALLVVYSHSFFLGSGITDTLGSITGWISYGQLAVWIFFIISGFLITKSFVQSQSLISYFAKRVLRIYPGLLVSLLFGMFIVGPLVTNLPLNLYFTNFSTYEYLESLSLLSMKYELPGVFLNNHFPLSVNGSIWTLQFEFLMYILVAILGFLDLLKKRIYIAVIYLLVISVYAYIFIFSSSLLSDFYLRNFLQLFITFSSGMLYYLYMDKIRYNTKLILLFTVLFIIPIIFPGTYFSYLFLLPLLSLPYITFYLAFLPIKKLNDFGKNGDFSYGVYIYAFPIQQTIAYFYPNISVVSMFLLSTILILPLAWFSWHFIESKALRLKNKLLRNQVKEVKIKPININETKDFENN